MKKILPILLAVLLSGCTKDNKTFTLKTIRLNDYKRTNLQTEKLYIKIYDDHAVLLTQTEGYPNDLTLPATIKVISRIPMTLYNRSYSMQLWGDSTGYISSCKVNMDEYKIIFPIDMEVMSDSLNISMMGSWK